MKIWVDSNPKEYSIVTDKRQVMIRDFDTPHTNNEAEYLAIINALKVFPEVEEIISDSQLVVNQLTHKYSIKEERLRKLASEVWQLAQGKVRFTWCPREDNLAGKVLG